MKNSVITPRALACAGRLADALASAASNPAALANLAEDLWYDPNALGLDIRALCAVLVDLRENGRS